MPHPTPDGQSLSTIALVTGGSQGIGLAIAEALIARGARVAIAGRTEKHLDAAVARLTRAATGSGAALAGRADVGNPGEAEKAVQTVADRFGGLNVLVNNAGLGTFANVSDMAIADWQRLIATNLSGVFSCCRAALPHLRRQGGGWIINISSLA